MKTKRTLLADLIEDAWSKTGFVSALIFGMQGAGKTTYALRTAYAVYGSWEEALRHLFFDPLPALELLQEANEKGERVKLVIFDDAGWWLSKYLWYVEGGISTIFAINGLFNLIRTLCSAVIFTSPLVNDVLKPLREKCWLRIKIRRSGHYGLATIYKVDYTPKLRLTCNKVGADRFVLYVNNDTYERYCKMRQEFINEQLYATIEVFKAYKRRIIDLMKKHDKVGNIRNERMIAEQK